MIVDYLTTAQRDFEQYKHLGEKTLSQVEEHELFWKFNEASNSMAIIVNHLHGNMKSRWTDFLFSDGEKPWRNRDLKFENEPKTKKEVIAKWDEGWKCVFDSLNLIHKDNFNTTIYIRNQKHSIIQAINRQIAHYAYHIGQLVYIGRMINGNNWENLSIVKGNSKAFNQKKFLKGKHGGQFTDDLK
jgi:hypothetical protein